MILAAGHNLGQEATFLHYVDQPAEDDGADAIHISDIHVPVRTG